MSISKSILHMLGAVVLVAGLSQCQKSVDAATPNLTADAHVPSQLNKEKTYVADLSALNNSGVSGTAVLKLSSTTLIVTIDATGLEANMEHPQHIHGHTDRTMQSTCPGMSADSDNDGVISLVEGLPSYGGVVLSLTPFPTADANGEIHYQQTFQLSELSAEVTSGLAQLHKRAIVLHGMTVDGTYVATLPVACGKVRNANGNNMD